jgi:chloramphenicol 3-O-phosphotransferase
VEGQGKIAILNGASSAGKTTLATSFRDRRSGAGEFWLVIGIDDFLAKLPAAWTSVGPDHGAFAAEGVRFERTTDGVTVAAQRTP